MNHIIQNNNQKIHNQTLQRLKLKFTFMKAPSTAHYMFYNINNIVVANIYTSCLDNF